MGKELEYKLQIPNGERLDEILQDGEIEGLRCAPWQQTEMRTTYFDTQEQDFAQRRWTFRHRMEGKRSVVCLKTPDQDRHTRQEFQVNAAEIGPLAVELLLQQGAPKELLPLFEKGPLVPVCGAEFLRRHVMLEFPDQSRGELAGDFGVLLGRRERIDLCELELELYRGDPEEMLSLLRRLCSRYGLKEQPLSKFARARLLK